MNNTKGSTIGLNPEEKEYVLNHLPIHLIRAGKTDELRHLMCDQTFLEESRGFYGVDWLSRPEVKAVISL